MSPGAPAITERANTQHVMSELLKSGIPRLDTRIENVCGTEDLLASGGELTLYVGDAPVGEEKYIVLWKKEDGKLKNFRDILILMWRRSEEVDNGG
jgi:hypothetical protein